MATEDCAKPSRPNLEITRVGRWRGANRRGSCLIPSNDLPPGHVANLAQLRTQLRPGFPGLEGLANGHAT